jgi:hypothetical protein
MKYVPYEQVRDEIATLPNLPYNVLDEQLDAMAVEGVVVPRDDLDAVLRLCSFHYTERKNPVLARMHELLEKSA